MEPGRIARRVEAFVDRGKDCWRNGKSTVGGFENGFLFLCGR